MQVKVLTQPIETMRFRFLWSVFPWLRTTTAVETGQMANAILRTRIQFQRGESITDMKNVRTAKTTSVVFSFQNEVRLIPARIRAG